MCRYAVLLLHNLACRAIFLSNKKGFMMSRICQSCSMPIMDDSLLGTEKDGSKNQDYCIYCYKNGEFIDKVSMEKYIEMNVSFYEQAGMKSADEMRRHCEKVFPTLKRWKK